MALGVPILKHIRVILFRMMLHCMCLQDFRLHKLSVKDTQCPILSHDFCYRKSSKYWDRKVSANSADPEQTAPWSSLIRVYTVCYSIPTFLDAFWQCKTIPLHFNNNYGYHDSVPIFRIFTVLTNSI